MLQEQGSLGLRTLHVSQGSVSFNVNRELGSPVPFAATM